MGENAYVLGGAPAVGSHKRRMARNRGGKIFPKKSGQKNLKALQTKTAPLGKAGLLINLAHWQAGISQGPCQPHKMGGNGLKLAMAAIAKRGFCRCFTPAEKHLFGCFSGNFYRRNACIFVAAITKRLFGTFATGTPEIGFAFFNFDWHW